MQRWASTLAMASALAFGATASTAVTILGTFQGTVAFADAPLDGSFTAGDSFSGSFSFDSNATDGVPANAELGSYAASNLALQVGTYSPNVANGGILIEDAPTYDLFEVLATGLTGPAISGFSPLTWWLRLVDSTASAFGGDSLPTSLSLADFDGTEIYLIFSDPNPAVVGTVTAISLSVPEPATAALGLAGLLALGLGAARARRSDATRRRVASRHPD